MYLDLDLEARKQGTKEPSLAIDAGHTDGLLQPPTTQPPGRPQPCRQQADQRPISRQRRTALARLCSEGVDNVYPTLISSTRQIDRPPGCPPQNGAGGKRTWNAYPAQEAVLQLGSLAGLVRLGRLLPPGLTGGAGKPLSSPPTGVGMQLGPSRSPCHEAVPPLGTLAITRR